MDFPPFANSPRSLANNFRIDNGAEREIANEAVRPARRRLVGVIAAGGRAFLGLGQRLFPGLPHLLDHEPGPAVALDEEDVRQAVQDDRPLCERRFAPVPEGEPGPSALLRLRSALGLAQNRA